MPIFAHMIRNKPIPRPGRPYHYGFDKLININDCKLFTLKDHKKDRNRLAAAACYYAKNNNVVLALRKVSRNKIEVFRAS